VSVTPAGAIEKGCGGLHVVFVDLKASVALLEAAEREAPRLSADDVVRVVCDPFGYGVVCGFRSGRIVRLEWNKPE